MNRFLPEALWPKLLALLLGAAWPLAFAPFAQSWLAFVLLGLLFVLVDRSPSPRDAAALGFFFGFGAFGAGVYWLAITLHNFAHMDWLLAGAAVALLAAYCALYSALAMGLARRFRGAGRWLALPVLWIFGEYLRARVATGFPWLATGYTQTWNYLGGYAPWFGQYGVGLITAGLASMGAWLLTGQRRQLWAWSFAGSLTLLLFALGLFAATVRFTHPVGLPLSVRLLQGNIPISEKWDPSRIDDILTRYVQLITQSPPGTQLVVLPETAFPILQTQIPRLIAHLQDWSATHHSVLIIGIPESHIDRYYNAAMEIEGHQPIRWYRKQHLVPFGEYIPFPRLLGPLVHQFLPGLGNFTPGRGSSVLPVDGQRAGMTICYEESFSRDVRKGVDEGATFLVNISDYAWYGHSIAAAQTLQTAAMQARQEQKPDIRATNTGITSVILPNGEVEVQLPQFSYATLNAKIQPMAGDTPFARYGNWPYLGLSALLLGLAFWRSRQNKNGCASD